MRKELKIVKSKGREKISLPEAFGINIKRRDQLIEFAAGLVKECADNDEGKDEIVTGIWNNKKFVDNEVAFMLFAIGGFIEKLENISSDGSSNKRSITGIVLRM